MYKHGTNINYIIVNIAPSNYIPRNIFFSYYNPTKSMTH